MNSCQLPRLLAPLFALAATAPLHADVITVDDNGPADYAEINVAIANSQDGDTILVKSGTYAPAPILGRAVNIVADEGATVNIDGYLAVVGLPAGKSVLLHGIIARAALENHYGLFLQNNAGSIRVQACSFEGYTPPDVHMNEDTYAAQGGSAILIESSSDVSIARSAVRGGMGQSADNFFNLTFSGAGGIGLEAHDSLIALHDMMLRGGNAGVADYGGRGGDALLAFGSEIFISGGILRGGNGGAIMDIIPLCEGGGDAIRADASSTVRDLGATIEGGDRSVFAGQWGDCLDGLPFAGGATFEHLLPGSRSLDTDSVVREGNLAQLTFGGEPGDIVLLASTSNAGHTYRPFQHGVWLLRYPAFVSTRVMGTVGGNGILVTSIAVGSVSLPAGARTIRLQAMHRATSGDQVLGAHSQIVVLDSSF